MRNAPARLLLGATFLVAGFGVLSDGSPLKNTVVHSAVEMVDMKERQCRKISAAQGARCPVGCEARPLRSPDERGAPPECHSPFWIATCGSACAPAAGYARLSDGRLADATRLMIVLDREPDAAMTESFAAAHVTLVPRFDGLYRYDGAVWSEAPLEKTKKRLSALPGVRSVNEVVK